MSTSSVGSSGSSPSFIDWAKDKVHEGLEFREKHEEQIEKGLELRELPVLVKDAFSSAKELKESGFSEAWSKARSELMEEAKNPSAPLDLIHKLKIGAGAFQSVAGLARLPGEVKGVWEAAQTLMPGSEKHGGEAADVRHEGLRDLKDMAWTGSAVFDTAVTGQKLVSTYKAAGAAFTEAVPGASKEVVKAAQRAAVKEAFKSTAKEAVKETTIEAAKKTVGEAVVKAGEKATTKAVEKAATTAVEKGVEKALVKTGEKALAEAALKEGGEVAAKAALKATAHAAESTLAKAAGRFAPGVNVAIAAIDVADAVNTLRNPDASTGKKACSCITAVGSIAAATNIPVVSQIGAGVSIVGSFIGSFLK